MSHTAWRCWGLAGWLLFAPPASARPSASPPPAPIEHQVAVDGLRLRISATSVSNLVYQLDCLSGGEGGGCASDSYLELWHELGWGPQDDEMLLRWATIQGHYVVEVPVADTQLRLANRLRDTARRAIDPEDYAGRAEVILTVDDGREAQEVLTHFWPRFSAWWAEVAHPDLARQAAELTDALQEGNVAGRLWSASQTFESRLPVNDTLEIDLVLQGSGRAPATRAVQRGQHGTVEMRLGASARDRAGTIAHEVTHALIRYGRSEHLQQLQQHLTRNHGVEGIGAWNLLNEGYPTALGQGILDRAIMGQERWSKQLALGLYDDANISRAAVAGMAFVELTLTEGLRADDPAFATGWMAVVREGLQEDLLSPPVQLHQAQIVTTLDHLAIVGKAMSTLGAHGWDVIDLADPHPESTGQMVNTLLILTAHDLQHFPNLPSVPESAQLVSAASKGGTPRLRGTRRADGSWVGLLMADDPDQVDAQLAELLRSRTLPVTHQPPAE